MASFVGRWVLNGSRHQLCRWRDLRGNGDGQVSLGDSADVARGRDPRSRVSTGILGSQNVVLHVDLRRRQPRGRRRAVARCHAERVGAGWHRALDGGSRPVDSTVKTMRKLAWPRPVRSSTWFRRSINVSFWWVNQGQSYAAERRASILWAPVRTDAGFDLVHWSSMTKVVNGM